MATASASPGMATGPSPGLYRDILPAWSDPNLKSLCRQIKSGLFLAHVRASTGGATSRANCHPFVSGRWSFMHNGQIGGFEQHPPRLESSISDAALRPAPRHHRFRAVLPADARRGPGARPAKAPWRAATARVIEAVAARRHRAVVEAHRRLLRWRDAVMPCALPPTPTRRRSTRRRCAKGAAAASSRSRSTAKAATGMRSRRRAS